MKRFAILILAALYAAPALAGVGLIDEPRWTQGGLCVDVASFEGAAVAVVVESGGVILLAWERGEGLTFDPGCEGANMVLLNPGTEGAEHRVVWVPVPCLPPPGLEVDDFEPRTLVVLDEDFDSAMTFEMGPLQAGDSPCAAAPDGGSP